MNHPISDDERDAREDAWQKHQTSPECPFCGGDGEVIENMASFRILPCPECGGTSHIERLP